MSSAPSTLTRRKSPIDITRNQRAVWSSSKGDEVPSSDGHTSRFNCVQLAENPPIISLPSPSPTILQQQTQEVRCNHYTITLKVSISE